MKETVNLSPVREAQMIELQIFKVFEGICQRHNLRYYFIGGTLIGVLRHKGFIPWDDDIDIGMPRNDYDKFIDLMGKECPNGYSVCDKDSDTSWNFNFVQFVDNQAVADIYMNEEPRRAHLWVDVFPLDGLPSNIVRRYIHMKHVLMYRYLVQIAHIRTQVDTHKVGRPWYEKVALRFFSIVPVGKLLNSRALLSRMERVLRKFNFDKSSYVGNLLGKYREKEVVPYSYFGEPVELPFEDIMVKCPAECHKLQTKLYGDYMKLPPEKYRVSHDIVIVSQRER